MIKAIESFGRWAIAQNLETVIIVGLVCFIGGYVFCEVVTYVKGFNHGKRSV